MVQPSQQISNTSLLPALVQHTLVLPSFLLQPDRVSLGSVLRRTGCGAAAAVWAPCLLRGPLKKSRRHECWGS